MEYYRIPHEGCLWSELEPLTFEELQQEWAGDHKSAGVAFVERWDGKRPVGLIYDFVIERINARKGTEISPLMEL